MVARIYEGFYNGSAFHRVIPGFMIQGGDPNSINGPKNTWGTGGYPTKVPAEFNSRKHLRGIMSAARTNDPNSFGGQFFICVAAAPWLDGQYTVFGEVMSGMDVADMIVGSPRDANDNPLQKISMTISTTVSVDEESTQSMLNVYPLPAQDLLTVSVPLASSISIMSVNGTIVKTIEVEAGTTLVDVNNLPCGAYVLASESASGTTYKPILISAR